MFVLGCFDNLPFFFFLLEPSWWCGYGVKFGLARIFVSIGVFAPRHISKYPASYLGFPAHIFSIPFSVHFLLLHCLSFPPLFIVNFFSLFLLRLSFAHLASFFLFPFYFIDLFLGTFGVCFSFGIHAWVVFVLYLTSYMAGFGFWVGGDDCWCASVFLSFFFISFPSIFPCISTTKLTKKDAGCTV